jgi:hypothetical protein
VAFHDTLYVAVSHIAKVEMGEDETNVKRSDSCIREVVEVEVESGNKPPTMAPESTVFWHGFVEVKRATRELQSLFFCHCAPEVKKGDILNGGEEQR